MLSRLALLGGVSRETPKGVLSIGLLTITVLCRGVWLRPADAVHVGSVAALCTTDVLSDVVSCGGSVDIVFGAIDMGLGSVSFSSYILLHFRCRSRVGLRRVHFCGVSQGVDSPWLG